MSTLWRMFFPKSPDLSESPNSSSLYDKDSIERKVVARFSRGNIRLQHGQYWTREEIDEGLKRARENALKYGD